jgi:hypothetical protein
LQGRINEFTSSLAKETGRAAVEVSVEWADKSEEHDHFFAENRLVLRLHEHDKQDRNLVTGSLLVVSQTLVRRAKSFLSKKQARSMDLYAVDKLLAHAAPARDLFHEEFLGPEVDADGDIRSLFEQLVVLDQAATFFPIFVRELTYLGQKVSVKPRDERLIRDVKELTAFLVSYSERRVGELGNLTVAGSAIRCAIVIVAKRIKREIGDPRPFVQYLEKLDRQGVESIYLIGSSERANRTLMDEVAASFTASKRWVKVDHRVYGAKMRTPEGAVAPTVSFLIALRRAVLADVLPDIHEEMRDLEAED